MGRVMVFLGLAIMTAVIGFSGVVAISVVDLFKLLFFIFVLLFIISLVGYLTRKPNPPAQAQPRPPGR